MRILSGLAQTPCRLAWGALLLVCGCIAGPKAEFSPEQAAESRQDHQRSVQTYDMDGNGVTEYGESRNASGRIDRLHFDSDEDGRWDEEIDLFEIPPEQSRHLIVILDSIPYALVVEQWEAGLLRYFPAPSCVIAPYPVMTDVSLAEFFGCSPCPGLESEYFDGERLTSGYSVYSKHANMPWLDFVDYALPSAKHSAAYLNPKPWFAHELGQIQETIRERADDSLIIGYVVGTSSLGASLGREGHLHAVTQLDRYCRRLMFESRGRIRLTLMSDHGHHFTTNTRVKMDDAFQQMGYRVGSRLQKSGDAVIPEFGMVSYAAVHTRDAAKAARDALGVEGVDVVAYRSDDGHVVVQSAAGTAEISTTPNGGLRYAVRDGDPLKLERLLANWKVENRRSEETSLTRTQWLELTWDHDYPDAVFRLWRAFHGLVENTPDVLISMQDGYYCGSGTMSFFVDLIGVHGNLRPGSTHGFVMSTAAVLPDVVRMDDLRAELAATDVPLQNSP